MRSSWADTGFREDAVHGYVCDRKVFWDLLKEEQRAASKKAAAGAPINLSYAALNIGPSDGADADGDSSSSSDDDEQEQEMAGRGWD
mmetsp:Transcript_6048/g.15845  ORF Transcript_6048/g.15845 Transcript_6048/m.15845 type:complete len:87 (+) Transcript_6048:2040-2300(+)